MRALLFDFDGLILDTETPELVMWSKIFSEHSVAFPMEYWVNALGRGASEIAERPPELLERLLGRPIDQAIVKSRYEAGRMALINAESPLPGVVDLLVEARSANIPSAVVSSSKHWWVDGHLQRLGLAEYFEITICADDVERAKPSPDLYLRALETLRIAACDAIALEDSPNGTSAALAAGIFVVAVPNQTTKLLDLSHASAFLPSLKGISLDALRALQTHPPTA